MDPARDTPTRIARLAKPEGSAAPGGSPGASQPQGDLTRRSKVRTDAPEERIQEAESRPTLHATCSQVESRRKGSDSQVGEEKTRGWIRRHPIESKRSRGALRQTDGERTIRGELRWKGEGTVMEHDILTTRSTKAGGYVQRRATESKKQAQAKDLKGVRHRGRTYLLPAG